MGSSLGFGSAPCNCSPIQTRFPYGYTSRLNLATEDNSLTHYAKGTRSPPIRRLEAPTVCRHTVSGSISPTSSVCFSPFPHGTCSLSVTREYLALEDGPPSFPRGFPCPTVLENLTTKTQRFRVRGCHPLRQAFPGPSTIDAFCNFAPQIQLRPSGLTTPRQQRLYAYIGMV